MIHGDEGETNNQNGTIQLYNSAVRRIERPKRKSQLKTRIQARTPKALLILYRLFRTGDFLYVISFLATNTRHARFLQRCALIQAIYRITYYVECGHSQAEILAPIKCILDMPTEVAGAIVEAGCFKGCGTAKLSLAVRLASRQLIVFDSFEGIPANTEPHCDNIWGGPVNFNKGDYCGSIEEFTKNVRRFGDISVSIRKRLFRRLYAGFSSTASHSVLRCGLGFLNTHLPQASMATARERGDSLFARWPHTARNRAIQG